MKNARTIEKLHADILKYSVRCFRAETQPTVFELARELGIPERSLNRLAYQFFSCSPKQYLTRVRREYAKRLQTRSSLTKDRLASRAGYGTTRSLHRNEQRERTTSEMKG